MAWEGKTKFERDAEDAALSRADVLAFIRKIDNARTVGRSREFNGASTAAVAALYRLRDACNQE